MIKDFRFNDIVLYSKGWYQHSDSIIDDLAYLFSKIYGYVTNNEGEIAIRMLHVLDFLYVELNALPNSYKLLNNHCYFEKEVRKRVNFYDVSRDKAIILTSLSILQGLSKDEIKLNAPHYGKKEHFRMGSLFGENPISMTYTEMNRRAKQMFG